MKFSFLFEPRDLWMGFFVDTKKHRLYFLPIPCAGVVFDWSKSEPKLQPQTHRHTLILAYSYPQAREWAAHHLPFHEDWRYCPSEEHLRGYRNVKLVKLDGWSAGKSRVYLDVVRRLETEQL